MSMTKLKKYSVMLSGHATSITLEPEFWAVLQKIAHQKEMSVVSLIGEVDDLRALESNPANLSSSLRVFVLKTLLTCIPDMNI